MQKQIKTLDRSRYQDLPVVTATILGQWLKVVHRREAEAVLAEPLGMSTGRFYPAVNATGHSLVIQGDVHGRVSGMERAAPHTSFTGHANGGAQIGQNCGSIVNHFHTTAAGK